MKKQSPVGRIWKLGQSEHGRLIAAVALALAVFPIAAAFMAMVMGGYAKDYEGAVKATTEMSGTMIEYINGIEVIKAYNQGKQSYNKLTDKVRANAQYYYDWMHEPKISYVSGGHLSTVLKADEYIRVIREFLG